MECKERLTASELDNDGGESGQEDASGLRSGSYRSGESPRQRPGVRRAGLQGRARR